MKKHLLLIEMKKQPPLLRRPLPPKLPKLPLYKKKTYSDKIGTAEPFHVQFTQAEFGKDKADVPDFVSKYQSEASVQDAQDTCRVQETAIAIPASENIFVPIPSAATGPTSLSTRGPVFKKERYKQKTSRKLEKKLHKVEKTYIQTKLEEILILSSKFSEAVRTSSSTTCTKIKKVISEDQSHPEESSVKILSEMLTSPIPSITVSKVHRYPSDRFSHSSSLVSKVVLTLSQFSGHISIPPPTLPRKPRRQSIIEMLALENEKTENVPRVFEGYSKSRRRESEAYILRGEGFKTISATKYETIIAMTNLAIMNCQIHGRNALNLKGFFLLHCPPLTSLAFQLLYLNLSYNDLRHFPTEIFCLKNLQVLKMRNNPIKEIPSEIHHLKFLRIFSIAFNLISYLPYGLFALYHLEELDISYNDITFIPNDIKNLRSLDRLNIDGNYLFFLPPGILKLNLTKIHFDNTFTHRIFWAENSLNSPQRLTHICCLFFVKNNLQKLYTMIPTRAQRLLKHVSKCEWCFGPKFGKGFRVIRSCDIFGTVDLPIMFHVCSSFCYRKVREGSFTSEAIPTRKLALSMR